MKITREIKLGIIVTATIFVFVWGVSYLKGKDIFNRQLTIYAEYENVSGLLETNPVVVSGVKIGQVERIYFHPDGSGKIMVQLILGRQISIPSNSVARLTGADFMGFREIDIVMGNSPQAIKNGDTLASLTSASITEEVSRQIAPLTTQAESLLLKIDSVLGAVLEIFNAETRRNLTQSIESMRQTLGNIQNTTTTLDTTFAHQAKRLAVIMSNAESITTNLSQNNQAITNVISNLSELSDTMAALEIAQTMQNVNNTMEALAASMDKINRGQGSLGLLVNDDQLYRNLEASSKQLEQLLKDIRQNPGRYINVSVFGRN